MTLRRIKPLPLPDVAVNPDLGPIPDIEWISPSDLYVDSVYQRELSKTTMRMLRKVISEFAWSRMKLPITVRGEHGHLHIIDGQHTAIAAATLQVPKIPVVVVHAATLKDRAGAFVSHNTDRVKVSTFDVFHAMVAAGEEEALDVSRVMERAGVRLRQINATSVVAEGDTMAIGTIRAIVRRRGVIPARKILQTLVEAKCAPITAPQILAVERVICEMRPGIDLADLSRIIRQDGDSGLLSAHSHAKIGKIPVHQALIERWRGKIGNAGRAA